MSLVWRGWKSQDAHPGEGKAQWDFVCVYKDLVKEYKENEPDASQGHPMKGQEAINTN